MSLKTFCSISFRLKLLVKTLMSSSPVRQSARRSPAVWSRVWRPSAAMISDWPAGAARASPTGRSGWVSAPVKEVSTSSQRERRNTLRCWRNVFAEERCVRSVSAKLRMSRDAERQRSVWWCALEMGTDSKEQSGINKMPFNNAHFILRPCGYCTLWGIQASL